MKIMIKDNRFALSDFISMNLLSISGNFKYSVLNLVICYASGRCSNYKRISSSLNLCFAFGVKNCKLIEFVSNSYENEYRTGLIPSLPVTKALNGIIRRWAPLFSSRNCLDIDINPENGF